MVAQRERRRWRRYREMGKIKEQSDVRKKTRLIVSKNSGN